MGRVPSSRVNFARSVSTPTSPFADARGKEVRWAHSGDPQPTRVEQWRTGSQLPPMQRPTRFRSRLPRMGVAVRQLTRQRFRQFHCVLSNFFFPGNHPHIRLLLPCHARRVAQLSCTQGTRNPKSALQGYPTGLDRVPLGACFDERDHLLSAEHSQRRNRRQMVPAVESCLAPSCRQTVLRRPAGVRMRPPTAQRELRPDASRTKAVALLRPLLFCYWEALGRS